MNTLENTNTGISIEWCLDRLYPLDMNAEWQSTLRMVLLAFYGLQAGDKRCRIAKFARDQRMMSQQTLMIRILEEVYLSTKVKYLNPQNKTSQQIADCLKFSRDHWGS